MIKNNVVLKVKASKSQSILAITKPQPSLIKLTFTMVRQVGHGYKMPVVVVVAQI